MSKALSVDLRERVVAVIAVGASCRAAAAVLAALCRTTPDAAARGMPAAVRVVGLLRLVAGALPTLTLANHGAGVMRVDAAGEGRVIKPSRFEPMLTILEPRMASHAVTRGPKPRTGSRPTKAAPGRACRTTDGNRVGLSSSTQSMCELPLRSIRRAEMLGAARFEASSDRLADTDAFDDAVGRMVPAKALSPFDPDGATIGPFLEIADPARDTCAAEREALVAVPDAQTPAGWPPTRGLVPPLQRRPGRPGSPAPRIGRRRRAVLDDAPGATEAERLLGAAIAIGDPA